MKYKNLALALSLLACLPLLVAPASAGTFSTNAWTNDASSGIVPGQTAWAYHFGVTNNAVVNGVTVPGIGTNGNPSVPGQFTVAGIPFVFLNDGNNLTALGGNSSAVMASNFIYGGSPGLLGLQGLTPGQIYTVSVYGVGHESPPAMRASTFSNGTDHLFVDENALGLGNGVRVDYTFTAGSATNLITVTPTNANTFHTYGLALRQPFLVVTNADSGPGSLRQAVLDSAAFGGTATITFATYLSGQTILLTNGPIVVNNNVTIDGSALTNGIAVNGNNTNRVFYINSGVTAVLTALTITNGLDPDGNGGGGIYNNVGTMFLNRCTLAGNYSSGGGGGILNFHATMVANQCTLAGNSTSAFGGGIDNNISTVTLNQCTLSGNTAGSDGGGINEYGNGLGGSLRLTNTIVALNSPDNMGGDSFSGNNNLTNGNPLLAPLGNYGGPTPTMPPLAGSPAIDAGTDTATNSFATDQRGQPRLSGAHVDIGAVEVNTNTIVTTVADTGAGSLRNALSVALVNDLVSFAPNLSGSNITLTNGELLLNKSVAIDASALAGGISLKGNGSARILEITAGSAIRLNSLTVANGFDTTGNGGGGVYLGSGNTLTVNNCTFAGNASTFFGGGIRNFGGTLTVNESTFAGNSCTEAGGGIASAGPLFINQSTVSQNSASSVDFPYGGGGIFLGGSQLLLSNSIVAGNKAPAGQDIFLFPAASLTYGGSNLAQYVSNAGSITGPLPLNAAPLLAALGNYGGPTPTMPPLAGSPAIDAGSDAAASGFATDQRGRPRLLGAHVDLGAVEVNPTTIVTTNADGVAGSLRNVIAGVLSNDLVSFAPSLSGSTITLGGAISLASNVSVDASSLPGGITVSGNDVDRVFNVSGGVTASLTSLTITGGATGDTSSGGGAIYNGGTLALNGCSLYNNFAYSGNTNDPTGGPGGAITSLGTLVMTQCTLARNSASGGSAIYNAGPLTLMQCTVSSNNCTAPAGGAIFDGTGGALTLSNSIVAANSGSSTVDVWNLRSTSTQVGTNIIQSLFNDFQGTNNGTTAISAAPRLAPFGNYGGPTPTMPPLPGSPAIDSAAATTLTTDQRGYPRPVGLRPDIGAVEGIYNAAGPGIITNFTHLGNGSVQFTFTNLTDASFPVLATTNANQPLSNWTQIGFAVESPVGSHQFPFTDTQASNYPARFYRIEAP